MNTNSKNKNSRTNKILKIINFSILLPGSAFFLIPSLLFQLWNATFNIGYFQYIGLGILIIGFTFYVLSVIELFLKGEGTPMFWFSKKTHLDFLFGEEPINLVFTGIYKRTRNPMYFGEWVFILGEAIFFKSWILLLLYVPGVFLFMHFIVIRPEEKHLKERYGKMYEEYLTKTPRWFKFRIKKKEKTMN
ncbi:MAG: methyltransferase family protein [Promethearchaeota archaeon]